ncbi:MAG: Gfo/Idh/MocA family oxidoreductase [Actinomycetota bacterium]|nr:Gfo/Idh/MocA family oxidoreductase [Actinomycetota bacterium]
MVTRQSPLPRVAVVGAGYWGKNLIRNFASSRHTDLIWVCDKDLDRCQATTAGFGDVKITDDFAEVLADPNVDAVAIATPVASHAAIAEASLHAGKHILVEKPLAGSVAEGRDLVQLADEMGRVFMTDHTFCYTSTVRHIRDMFRAGEIGDLQYFDSVRINLGLVQPDVDVFWDLAPHDLSILLFVLPDDIRPVRVWARGADPLGVGKPSLGYVSIEFSNGALANIHVNWLSPVKVRTTIIGGSEKMLVWDDLNPAQRLSVFDTGVHLDGDAEERRQLLISYRSGDMVAPALKEREALGGLVEEFAAAIVEEREPLTSGRDGLEVLEILSAVHESLGADGAGIALDAASRR